MKERANPRLKFLDAVLGRALVFALGAWALVKRLAGIDRRHRAALAERLLTGGGAPVVFTLLKSAAIGDTVLLSAIAQDLRQRYPACVIRMACGGSNAQAARLIAAVDEVVTLPMSSPLGIWRALRSIRADVLIDFDSWPRINALIAFLSGSPVTVGFKTAGQHRHFAYTRTVDHDPSIHEIDNYRRLLQAATEGMGTAPTTPAEPTLRLPASGGDEAGAAGFAVVHMFSGGSQAHFKEWPAAHWRAVADHLRRHGLKVLLSGGPGEVARNEAFRASWPGGAEVELVSGRPLGELAALLAKASVVVSVDTGVAHLAGAVAAPTIALHGPTSPARWGARGPRVHHLKDSQPPWISLGFERSQTGQPMQVEPARVMALVTEILNASAAPRFGT